MSVCSSARSQILKSPCPNFTKSSAHVNCRRGSVLLWRQCNTLCTSGFVGDVTISHNKANWWESKRNVRFVQFARWRHRERSLPTLTPSCFVLWRSRLVGVEYDTALILQNYRIGAVLESTWKMNWISERYNILGTLCIDTHCFCDFGYIESFPWNHQC